MTLAVTDRRCEGEGCGNRIPPGVSRHRSADGKLLCPACAAGRPSGVFAAIGGESFSESDFSTDHPRYHYHWSKTKDRASILEHGLQANRSLGGKNTRVYLWKEEQHPTARMDTKPTDMWRVDTQGIALRDDPELPGKWAISHTDIEPNRLELIDTTHPDGMHRTARQQPGDVREFGDYTMRYDQADNGERKPRHIISAYHSGKKVGELNWYGTTGTIHNVDVDPDHMRHGVATAMWQWGQEMTPKPKHSADRTTQGDEWARSVGGPRPRRTRGSMQHIAERTFDEAVETARANIPIMKEVTRPEAWSGFTIVRDRNGNHHVVDGNAWEQPSTPGAMPWSAPTGTPVADVDMDGNVTKRSVLAGVNGANINCDFCGSHNLAETERSSWAPGWTSWKCLDCDKLTHIKKSNIPAPIRDAYSSLQRIAHDSGDGFTIFHCPFCGSGMVIGRGDGSAECAYCSQVFTVQVQPFLPGLPQTDPNVPLFGGDHPAPGQEPDTPAEEADDAPNTTGETENKAQAALFVTSSGTALDRDAYMFRLALEHADDRDAVVLARQAANENANSWFERVTPTQEEIDAHVAKFGRKPATYRYRCKRCDTRLWGSGLGIGSHIRKHRREDQQKRGSLTGDQARARMPVDTERHITLKNGGKLYATIIEHGGDHVIVGQHPNLYRVPYEDIDSVSTRHTAAEQQWDLFGDEWQGKPRYKVHFSASRPEWDEGFKRVMHEYEMRGRKVLDGPHAGTCTATDLVAHPCNEVVVEGRDDANLLHGLGSAIVPGAVHYESYQPSHRPY